MFAVPFQTAMSDADIHRLNSVLGMDTHLHPEVFPAVRQPRRVTSGLLLRPVPRPRRRASGLLIGGSHVGSPGARKRSGLARGRGRRGAAAGSHGPGAVAARDPWPTNDHRRAEQDNRSSVDPFALQPPATQGGLTRPAMLPIRPRWFSTPSITVTSWCAIGSSRRSMDGTIAGIDPRSREALEHVVPAPASESSSNRASSRGASRRR